MRKIVSMMAVAMAVLLLAACSTPEERSLRTLQELYEDLQQNHETYTLEDWDKAQADFDALMTQIKFYKYTDEQLYEIGQLSGKCSAYLTEGAFKRLEKGIIQGAGMLKGYFELMNLMAPKDSVQQ